MFTNTSRIPEDRRVYLLADHLDAILATGEDLKCLFHNRASISLTPYNPNLLSLEAFVAKARKLEFAAMGRIKLARIHTEEIGRRDDSFGALARLFAGATRIVVDAIDEVCDSEHQAFSNGFDPLVYLRGRGLINDAAGCLNSVGYITIDDGFLIAERIELGALLDMCAEFLDFMDHHFDLFPGDLPPAVLLPNQHVPRTHPSATIKEVVSNKVLGLALASLQP